ncbi:MAG: hypothetical protein AAF743_05465 [Planctomycetota bacterium]
MVTIKLEPAQARWASEQVKLGRASTIDAAVNAALADHEHLPDPPVDSPEFDELHMPGIREGIAQADRGEFVDFDMDEFMARKRKEWGL